MMRIREHILSFGRVIKRQLGTPPFLPESYSMAHFGQFMRDETFLYSAAYARSRVTLDGSDALTHLTKNSGVIVVFLHYGSFFLAGGAIVDQLSLPYTAIASRRNLEVASLQDRAFWYGVHERSSRFYSRPLFYTDESPRQPLAWLKQGGILGVVLDVREQGQKIREDEYCFLSKKIYMQSGPARLACIAGVPIVPVTICYVPAQKRHNLYFDRPIFPDGDPVGMTQRLLDILGPRVEHEPRQQFYDIAACFDKPAS